MAYNIHIHEGKGSKKQKYFWRLEDSKGVVLGCGGEPFSTRWSSKRSVNRLDDLLQNDASTAEIATNKKGEWFWRIRARNARLMARGTVYYPTKAKAKSSLVKFTKAFSKAVIA